MKLLTKIIKRTYQFLRQDKFAMVGAIIYFVFFIIAVFAPQIAPYDPHEKIRVGTQFMFNKPPGGDFLLGTTNMGRDIFSQLVYG
ncbi:MAG: D,D-dipeptide ABC transporter permease, partial [Bacillota bacterium]